jgi:signal transduction histidine kinase
VELEVANRQLRAFSHTVSHDLRTPLLTIRGFCSMLEQRVAPQLQEDGRHGLQVIRQEAERMAHIVDDVLYLANIDRTPVQRATVDLAALARDTLQALQASQPARELAFDCPATAPAACDEQLVRVALANLLGNAWKFTGRRADARIAFRAQQDEDGRAVYVVEDNGAGFDMAYAHRLFKPFERLHRSEEFEGFGVGLATVQRIVSLHHGKIRAESAPGQGARFYFSLGSAGEADSVK